MKLYILINNKAAIQHGKALPFHRRPVATLLSLAFGIWTRQPAKPPPRINIAADKHRANPDTNFHFHQTICAARRSRSLNTSLITHTLKVCCVLLPFKP